MVIKMKKYLSLLLAIFMIFLFNFFVYAEDPVTLSLRDEKVYAGDEFTLNLFISDNSQMSGAVIDINYDNQKLEFMSAKEGAILDAQAKINIRNVNGDKSYVRFTYMSGTSSIVSEGVLFSITFKVLESATGETDLSISIPYAADFVSSNLEKLSYTVENSKVTIINNNVSETIKEETTEDISTDQTESLTESSDNNTTEVHMDKPINTNLFNNKTIYILLLSVGVLFVVFGILIIKKRKQK